MAGTALSLLLLSSLCVVALCRFDEYVNRPPYRPTLPNGRPPLTSQNYYDDGGSDDKYYNSVNNKDVNNRPYGRDDVNEQDFDSYNSNGFESYPPQRPSSSKPYGDDFQPNQNRFEQSAFPNFQTDSPSSQSRVPADSQPQGTEQESHDSGSSDNCKVADHYQNSYPSGNIRELDITPLEANSPVQCLQQCCTLGPTTCQYIWVLKDKCYAVACSPMTESLCMPREMSSNDGPATGYYKIQYSNPDLEMGGTDATKVAPTSGDNVTTETSKPEALGREGEAPTDQSDNEPPPVDDTQGTEVLSTEEESQKTGQTSSETGLYKAPDTPPPPNDAETVSSSTEPTSSTPPPPTTVVSVTTATTVVTPPTLANLPDNPRESLTVAIAGTKEVTLPDNEVRLFASPWPRPPGVVFHWSRVSGVKEGELNGIDEASIVLSGLVPGVYGLRVTVKSPDGEFGEAFVNVTVHDKPRDNTPPRAIISPSTNYTVDLPQDTVIFDASQTQDDMGLNNLKFHWQLEAGPMGMTGESDKALLTLTNPQPGKYRYKLTITDADGAQTVALVDLKVVPEQDYLPLANAGSDIVLKMPNSEVVLKGNQSSDDKPGLKYHWEIVSGQRGVDMEGTDGAELHVSKLTVGVYHFRLTVTDSAQQTAFSEVTVDVIPEHNEAPVPVAGGPYNVHYPVTQAVLDGSRSHDDYEEGMLYSWIQTSGPSDIHLSGEDTARLSVTGLHIDQSQGSPTTYTFNFTMRDYANLTSTDTAVLTYYKDPKILPHVSAGPDITVTLPQNTAVLNGSTSWDDFGIKSYKWTRSNDSPAAGIPLLDSDTKPVLILSNLVNATYNFTLRVTNKQGMSASDMMVLRVLANPYDHYIVQLHLKAEISNFSRSDMQDLGKYLSLTLDDYTIKFQGVYESGPHTVVEFYAIDTVTHTLMNVTEAWKKLTENGQDYEILHYHVVQVEMKECQLSCSGHGSCDHQTKRCRCDVFWMENPFTAHTGRHESNCGWSVFYVVLIVLGALLVAGVIIWTTCWCCLRKRNLSRTKRRIRYAIHDHSEAGESKRMLSKGQQYIELKEGLGYQHRSLMQSESETEEEILFDTSKKGRASSPGVKNNKLNAEKYGKNSSLVNTVIPK